MRERDERREVETAATGEPDFDVDLDLLDYLQSLTPAQRLERHDQAMALVRALWRAGRTMNGD